MFLMNKYNEGDIVCIKQYVDTSFIENVFKIEAIDFTSQLIAIKYKDEYYWHTPKEVRYATEAETKKYNLKHMFANLNS
jgi:hypothetical protein